MSTTNTSGVSRGFATLTSMNYALLAAVGIGAYMMAQSRKAEAAGVNIKVKAGETWQLTRQAIGGKYTQAAVDLLSKTAAVFGSTTISTTISPDGTTLTQVIKLSRDGSIPPLNKAIMNPADPSQGEIITAAVRIDPPPSVGSSLFVI